MSGAELAARRTAAAAALEDFHLRVDDHVYRLGAEPSWHDWAFRLAEELSAVLGETFTAPAASAGRPEEVAWRDGYQAGAAAEAASWLPDLDDVRRRVLGQALADAVAYLPSPVCARTGDAARAEGYLALGRDLDLEVAP